MLRLTLRLRKAAKNLVAAMKAAQLVLDFVIKLAAILAILGWLQ